MQTRGVEKSFLLIMMMLRIRFIKCDNVICTVRKKGGYGMIYKMRKRAKTPEYFRGWFRTYGLMDDNFDDVGVERIAWRAYRRGVADTKEKLGVVNPTCDDKR